MNAEAIRPDAPDPAHYHVAPDSQDYPVDRIALDSEVYTALCAQAHDYAEAGGSRRAVDAYGATNFRTTRLLLRQIAAVPSFAAVPN